MNRAARAWTRISGYAVRLTAVLSRRHALIAIVALCGGVLWLITVAPPAVGFALTVAVAAAWCAWLEWHPEAPRPRID